MHITGQFWNLYIICYCDYYYYSISKTMLQEIKSQIHPAYCSLQQKGYFGKSSKRRQLQPNMFEILTWSVVQIEKNPKKKINQRIIPVHDSIQIGENQTSNKQALNDKGKAVANNGDRKCSSNKNLKRSSSQRNPIRKNQSQLAYRSPKYQKCQSNAYAKSKQVTNKSDNIFQKTENDNQQKMIEEFRQTTRWLPNSSFTTYFGKPAFENYGRGNLTPANGGVLYGDYLKSHNVQPHRGANTPSNEQSYSVALHKAQKMGTVYPRPPKSKKIQIQSNNCSPYKEIYPKLNKTSTLVIAPPNLYQIERFGGTANKKYPKLRN